MSQPSSASNAHLREEIALEKEVLHRTRGISDAPAAVERAVSDRAVVRNVKERHRQARFPRLLAVRCDDRNAQKRRTFGNRHGTILEDRLGGEKLFPGVVPAPRHLPRAAADSLVAEVGRDLQPSRLARLLDLDVVARVAPLFGRVHRAVFWIKSANRRILAPRNAGVEPVQAAVHPSHAVSGAIARDIPNRHVLHRAVRRVPLDVETHRPLGVVSRVLVVVLVVVALQRAVHEVRVIDVREVHDDRMAAGERVLLQHRAVQVERQGIGQRDFSECADTISPRKQDNLAEARRRLVVQQFLKSFRRRDRRLLHGVRVVASVIDDLRHPPRPNDRLAVARGDVDGIARGALPCLGRVLRRIFSKRLLRQSEDLVSLRLLWRLGEVDENLPPEIAVVSDAIGG